MTTELPTGTLTFLFSDIEGSTRLLSEQGDAYTTLVEDHQRLLRDAFTAGGGHEVSTEGDSFFVVFRSAPRAVAAAVAAQRALTEHAWPPGVDVKVRMGLHTGEGLPGGDNYVGLDVNRAARIAAAGHGGQVLLSSATRALVQHALPEGVTLTYLGEYRLKDLPAPEHLFQVDIPELPSHFPALRTLESRSENLPEQLTHFIGRETEIEKVLELLEQTRLLTLTGPGGSGKTRLSIEVARRVVPMFHDGVFFVALAPITEPALVAPTIGRAMGIREMPNEPYLETLRRHLEGRETLIVLDNFEQVVDAAPVVAEVLASTKKVKLIVTSREVLRIAGEQEYHVPPLGVPDPSRVPSPERLSQYESVSLFIDRARAVRPSFEVTNENAAAVAEICARLEGLPLALELAAARIKILSPQAMLARLDTRLPFLAGGSRDLPARQQTLRGAIAWSYDLLDDDERSFFDRLGIFRGGFTVEAAEEIANPDAECGLDTLDALSSLADKSLIRQIETEHGDPRFLMLETIREFALERLQASNASEVISGRHALTFLRLARETAPNVFGADAAAWLDRLAHDHDNIRSAISWATGKPDPELALEITTEMWRFWQIRGHLNEGMMRLQEALSLPGAEDTPKAYADALEAAGGVAYWTNDFHVAEELYERCLEIRRELGDTADLARALYNLSFIFAFNPGSTDVDRTEALLAESEELYRQTGDEAGMANVLWAKAGAARERGDLDGAVVALERALAMYREQGNRFGEGWALHQYSLVDLDRQDLAAAKRRAADALRLFVDAGDMTGQAIVSSDLAAYAFRMGDVERAAFLDGVSVVLQELSGGALLEAVNELEEWNKERVSVRKEHPEAFERARSMEPAEAAAEALEWATRE